jgi:hypothetical protein
MFTPTQLLTAILQTADDIVMLLTNLIVDLHVKPPTPLTKEHNILKPVLGQSPPFRD